MLPNSPVPSSSGSTPPDTLQAGWRLSEAVFRALHQWPQILLFCLVGGLLGWAATYLWPPAYRTRAEIYVSLNPYKAYTDSQFLALAYPQYSNIDDYKNWQMSQLSGAIFTDDILRETLEELRQEDPYWLDIDLRSLRGMLRAEWRTAGTWTLLADHRSAKRSNQAVRSWSRKVVSNINLALSASELLTEIDEEMRALRAERIKTEQLELDYQASQAAFRDWLVQVNNSDLNQPLPTAERWKILHWVGRITQFSPGWIEILAARPDEDAPRQAYVEWVERLQVAIKTDLPALEERRLYLDGQYQEFNQRYEQQKDASLGLSPNLQIKALKKSLPETLRPSGPMLLFGAIAGLLAWVIWLLATLTGAPSLPQLLRKLRRQPPAA